MISPRPIALALAVLGLTLLAALASDRSPLAAQATRARPAVVSVHELRQTPLCPGSATRLCAASGQAAGLSAALRKGGKLSGPLEQLAAEAQRQGGEAAAVASLPKSLRDLTKTGLMRLGPDGAVQVYVQTNGDASSALPALAGAGAKVERVGDGVVQAWLPASQLRAVAASDAVAHVRLPDYPTLAAGSTMSEGDAILHANDLRATLGIDGSGVRVGVISDGVEGLALSQASSDLPAVNTTTCNVVSQSPTSLHAGAEGTAMLEIVHDLAPGAELWFGHFGFGFAGTDLDFMAAVNCLASHVDIVVDDIGFFNNGPYDGTSPISLNTSATLSNPTNPVRGYYTAVANQALQHYAEPWSDSGFTYTEPPDVWNLQRFAATSTTSDAGLGLSCHCADAIALAPGGSVIVDLQWNDPFGASANDYDLFLLLNGTPVAVGGNAQNGSADPTEELGYVNDSGSPQILDLAIGNFNGTAAPRSFNMFIPMCTGCAPLPDGVFGQPFHNFNTRCGSVPNNADAGGGVVSLGAISAHDPGTNSIEPFSSCGPTTDSRLKPDAAAIDGVSVTGNGGFPSPFYGTSAAAPHAAAIAALLLSCNSSLTRDQLRSALLNSAVDLGSPGNDNIFGHGRIDALAAGNAAGCVAGAPTPTPTATRTPTGPAAATPTPTATQTPTGPAAATPTATATDTPMATPTGTATGTPTGPAQMSGDVNCDHTVTSIDAALVLQRGAGLISSLACPLNADVNDDGQVNSIDSLLILQYVAGLIGALPAGSPAGVPSAGSAW